MEGWPARPRGPLFAVLTGSELHGRSCESWDGFSLGIFIKISSVSENDLFCFRSIYSLLVYPSLQGLRPGRVPDPPLLTPALAFHSWHHGWCKGYPVAGCHPGPLGPPEVSHKSESCQPSRAVGR